MKHVTSLALLGLLALVAAPALTQETPAKPAAGKPTAAAPDKPSTAKPAADDKDPKGRLPNNYGKLDLTTAQKDKIYALQDDYRDKLDELTKQIIAIKEQRDASIEGVLTPPQKKKLEELLAESKAKAEARKKEVEAKKAAAAGEKSTEAKPAEPKLTTKPATEK